MGVNQLATKAFRDLRSGLALAERSIAHARSVDDILSIDRKLSAVREMAKAAGLGARADLDVFLARMEAKRKGGELLGKPTKHGGGNPRTLKDHAGLLANAEATRWRLLRWDISQVLWDELAEHYRTEVDEGDGSAIEWSQAAYLAAAKGVAHVSHNSGENEWYTPPDILEKARAAMGSIDCDPASSKAANEHVKAELYFSEDENGLEQEWHGNVWMNPPYAQPLIGDFAHALVSRVASGEIEQACVLVNNATETAWFQLMAASCAAICFPLGRIRFLDQKLNPSGAPLQGQAILYFGKDARAFLESFGGLGFTVQL